MVAFDIAVSCGDVPTRQQTLAEFAKAFPHTSVEDASAIYNESKARMLPALRDTPSSWPEAGSWKPSCRSRCCRRLRQGVRRAAGRGLPHTAAAGAGASISSSETLDFGHYAQGGRPTPRSQRAGPSTCSRAGTRGSCAEASRPHSTLDWAKACMSFQDPAHHDASPFDTHTTAQEMVWAPPTSLTGAEPHAKP